MLPAVSDNQVHTVYITLSINCVNANTFMSPSVYNLLYLPPRELLLCASPPPLGQDLPGVPVLFHDLGGGLGLQQLKPLLVGHPQAKFQRRLCCHMAR